MPTTAAPRPWASRCATVWRSTGWRWTAAASSRPMRAASASRRALCGRQRRLRIQPGVDARGLGPERTRRVAVRQLRDPRHALQPGRAAEEPAGARRRPHRRPHAEPLRGHRRARAAVRRRHLHAGGLRLAGHHGQPRRPALLRRGRGLLAQALRDLGPAGRAAGRADRLLDHRRQGRRPLHAAGVPRREGRDACPRWPASSACPKPPS
jgi:hypothetical protein